MNYLGNIEDEFSQMAISNRTAILESPAGLATPSRGGAIANKSAIDDTSFLGSVLGGEEPR